MLSEYYTKDKFPLLLLVLLTQQSDFLIQCCRLKINSWFWLVVFLGGLVGWLFLIGMFCLLSLNAFRRNQTSGLTEPESISHLTPISYEFMTPITFCWILHSHGVKLCKQLHYMNLTPDCGRDRCVYSSIELNPFSCCFQLRFVEGLLQRVRVVWKLLNICAWKAEHSLLWCPLHALHASQDVGLYKAGIRVI